MSWDQIKNNPAKLQELVDKYGVRGLARRVGVSHPTVINYMKRYGLTKTTIEKQGSEEAKPRYEKTEAGYVVYYGKHKVEIARAS